MDCIAYGVTKSRTQLSDFHFTSLLRSHISKVIYSLMVKPSRTLGGGGGSWVQRSFWVPCFLVSRK